MRFAAVVLAFAAAATAQSTNTVAAAASSVVASADPAQSSQLTKIEKCVKACDASDVGCLAKCNPVPNPDKDAVNQTNKCVAACPKGKGTKEDNEAYSTCLTGCIGQYYYTATGSPQATGTSGSDSGSGSSAGGSGSGSSKTTGGSGSKATGTQTGGSSATGSSAPNSTNAAQIMQVGGTAAGLLSFLAAVLAL